MSCETFQEQVSLLIDAELEESDQVALFRHFGGCPACRQFFDSMVRFRKAARMDQEEMFRSAGELLPQRSPLPSERRPTARGTQGWLQVIAGGWRMPAPVAVGLALVLMIAGALLGARIAVVSESPGSFKPSVVVVCGLPEVEVVGTGLPR